MAAARAPLQFVVTGQGKIKTAGAAFREFRKWWHDSRVSGALRKRRSQGPFQVALTRAPHERSAQDSCFQGLPSCQKNIASFNILYFWAPCVAKTIPPNHLCFRGFLQLTRAGYVHQLGKFSSCLSDECTALLRRTPGRVAGQDSFRPYSCLESQLKLLGPGSHGLQLIPVSRELPVRVEVRIIAHDVFV
jgi:hypothetical protein